MFVRGGEKIAESGSVLVQEYIHKKKEFLWILETYNEKNLEYL